eukprot:1108963-Pleurochrysis_carterae.AAC.1
MSKKTARYRHTSLMQPPSNICMINFVNNITCCALQGEGEKTIVVAAQDAHAANHAIFKE